MKKSIIIPAVLLIVCVICFGIMFWVSEPAQCPLCNTLKRHAPCLVNLSTGEFTELELYQPHHTYVGEIAEAQDSSTFSYFYAAGVQGTRTTSPYVISLPIPLGKPPLRLSAFCNECRHLFTNQSCGYALVDLYNLDTPVSYKIYDGATYELRCYQITVEQDSEKDIYNLTVKGTLEN